MKKEEPRVPPIFRQKAFTAAADYFVEFYTASGRPDDAAHWRAQSAAAPTGTDKK